MSQPRAPRSGTATAAERKRASKPKLVEHQSITVKVYDDGGVECFHQRLDLGSRKIVTEALPVPPETWDCDNPTAHMLDFAAYEWLSRLHGWTRPMI